MSEDLTINIRSIQHFMYCPRRYALLELNQDWNENALVVKANLIHEHVHDGSHSFSDTRKIVRSDIAVWNDLPEYNLFGRTDCIEFIRQKSGTEIPALDGKFSVRIIEYKPNAPKTELFHETDAIQVFAQKLCADYIWNCNSECFLYYDNTRKRVKLPFDTEYQHYNTLLKSLLSEMRQILQAKTIPPRKKGQKCSGCSLADFCFPKEKKYNVKNQIMSMKEEKLHEKIT